MGSYGGRAASLPPACPLGEVLISESSESPRTESCSHSLAHLPHTYFRLLDSVAFAIGADLMKSCSLRFEASCFLLPAGTAWFCAGISGKEKSVIKILLFLFEKRQQHELV